MELDLLTIMQQLSKRRDSRIETTVFKEILRLPRKEREILLNAAFQDPGINHLLFLSHAQMNRKFLSDKLQMVLVSADISTLKHWIKSLSRNIGPKQFLKMLHSIKSKDPERIPDIFYWISYTGFKKSEIKKMKLELSQQNC